VLSKIAANQTLSDSFTMGGTPKTAQAIAVLPHGQSKIVEEDLFQLLAGARAVFDREGVAIVGGDSSEGAELSVGFAISGAKLGLICLRLTSTHVSLFGMFIAGWGRPPLS
jgi:selenide, water dikinase